MRVNGAAMADRPFPSDQSRSEQFIREIRHRLWLIRAVESVGVCILFASAAGALAAGVMRFGTGRVWPIDAMPAVWSIAIVLGLIVAWRRRPSLLHVAMEVDRQLDLHELMSSVLLSERSKEADSQWHAALVAAADARCRAITPGQLALHRLGARSWGGIGLAMALSLVVSVMLATTDPRSSITSAQAEGRSSSLAQVNAPGESTVMAANPQRPDLNPQSQHFSGEQDMTERTSPRAVSSGSSAHSSNATVAASGASGIGRTQQSPGPSPLLENSTTIGTSQHNGTVIAGGGAANTGGDHGNTDAAGSTSSPAHSNTAPWDATTWSSDRATAVQAADNGSIPDSYRDVVRDYFQR